MPEILPGQQLQLWKGRVAASNVASSEHAAKTAAHECLWFQRYVCMPYMYLFKHLIYTVSIYTVPRKRM